MTYIYAEFTDNNVPILITDHQTDNVLVEVRAYDTDGEERGAIWQTITFEQAKILRDNLTKWINDVEDRRRRGVA